MQHLDPLSLVFTNLLVTLVVAVVLLVSRLGLRDAGAGVRSWVLGDVLLMLARTLLVDERGVALDPSLGLRTVLAAALFHTGVLCHLQALWRVSGWRAGPARSLAWALMLPAAVGAVGLACPPASSSRRCSTAWCWA